MAFGLGSRRVGGLVVVDDLTPRAETVVGVTSVVPRGVANVT